MKLKSLLVRFWFVLVLFGLSHILTVTEPNDASGMKQKMGERTKEEKKNI